MAKTNRTAARKSKQTAKPMDKRTADRLKRFRREEVKLFKSIGRGYAVGTVGKTGRILSFCFCDLTLDEAEVIVEGTKLHIIAGGSDLKGLYVSPTYKLSTKLYEYRNAQIEKRWPKQHKTYQHGKLAKNRRMAIWVLVHQGGPSNGRIQSVTDNQEAAGAAIEHAAIDGRKLVAYRVPFVVPMDETKLVEFSGTGEVRKSKGVAR